MRVPAEVLPVLEAVSNNPRFKGRVPVETWRTEDHRLWIDAFLELGCELYASDIGEEGLPEGYLLAAYLFDWESQCQFSGWYALSNRSDTIDRVIEYYRRVGLADEAEAVARADAAWRASGGSHEQAAAAYGLARPRFSDEERLEHMACYLVDNANTLFYLPEAD